MDSQLLVLAISFFIIAAIYSAVGFGGGSSYVALLALSGIPFAHIPIVGLVCNVIVTASGSWHFSRAGHFQPSLLWPFLLGSLPFAFLGGSLKTSESVFFLLLGLTLVGAGLRLVVKRKDYDARLPVRKRPVIISLLIGIVLGLLAGLTGIGGGIFLAPILINYGWGHPKQVASAASFFILANSLAGLFGQMIKINLHMELLCFWPLALVVFIGGQIGSKIASGPLVRPWAIVRLTGILTLIVGLQLLHKEMTKFTPKFAAAVEEYLGES